MKCRLKMPPAEKIDVPLNVPSKRQNYQKKNLYFFLFFNILRSRNHSHTPQKAPW